MATYSDTSSETLGFLSSDSSINTTAPVISEGYISVDSVITSILCFLTETLNALSNEGSSSVLQNSISDIITSIDNTQVLYAQSVSEGLVVTDSISNILHAIARVLDYIYKSENTLTASEYNSVLTSTLNLLATIDRNLFSEVSENIAFIDSVNEVYRAIISILEVSNIVDNLSGVSIISLGTSSDILIDSENNTRSLLRSISESSIIVKVGEGANSSYLAYLLSPETNSVSTYTNYNFNGCTKFGYKYLFYNREGLYEYGGSTDNGDAIRSEIETVAFNFNTSNLKQVPSIYLGVDSTDKVILKVRVDGKAEVHYQLNKFTNNLMTQKIDIGKGLIGRYFQFELITEASEFNMESIEFYPLEIRRKL